MGPPLAPPFSPAPAGVFFSKKNPKTKLSSDLWFLFVLILIKKPYILKNRGEVRLFLKDGRSLELYCTPATAAQTICIGQRLISRLQPTKKMSMRPI